MKMLMTLITALMIFFTASLAMAEDVYVNGYTRSNGTYVAPHYRTAPDSTVNNNYSTQGNVNPYTGREGTQPRDYSSSYGGYSNNNSQGSSGNSLGGGYEPLGGYNQPLGR